MKILVTGASGYVGKSLVESLSSRYELLKLSRTQKGEGWINADLTKPSTLKGICKGVDTVIHLAGIGDINALGAKYYKEYRKVNVEGTENLLKECKRAGVKKFVHISSLAAMGRVKGIVNESTPCNPVTPYERTKYESEFVVKESEIPYVILRPPRVYGGQKNKLNNLFERMGLVPDVETWFELIHINNLIKAVKLAISSDVKNQTYIVTDDHPYTVTDFARIQGSRSNKIIKVPLPAVVYASGFSEVLSAILGVKPIFSIERARRLRYNKLVDISLIRKELGYSPEKCNRKILRYP